MENQQYDAAREWDQLVSDLGATLVTAGVVAVAVVVVIALVMAVVTRKR